jgi:hypothetical protein
MSTIRVTDNCGSLNFLAEVIMIHEHTTGVVGHAAEIDCRKKICLSHRIETLATVKHVSICSRWGSIGISVSSTMVRLSADLNSISVNFFGMMRPPLLAWISSSSIACHSAIRASVRTLIEIFAIPGVRPVSISIESPVCELLPDNSFGGRYLLHPQQ